MVCKVSKHIAVLAKCTRRCIFNILHLLLLTIKLFINARYENYQVERSSLKHVTEKGM